MAEAKPFQRVSEAPTNPSPHLAVKTFDVADLYRGPADRAAPSAGGALPLDEKLRQAYFWIVNNAIISPHYDVEYDDGHAERQAFTVGDSKTQGVQPSGHADTSYVLKPLLK